MRRIAAPLLLVLFAPLVFPLELKLSSHTRLSPAYWTETLSLDAISGAFGIQGEAGFDPTGFTTATVGARYRRESLCLWAEAELGRNFSPSLTLGTDLFLAEFLGFGVEAKMEESRFAGATFSLWFGAYAEGEGSSRVSGVFELGGTGAPTGQTLCVGVSFPPVELQSTARFDGGGFASLELWAGARWKILRVGMSSGWAPAGLRSVGGSFCVFGDGPAFFGEFTWFLEGDWRIAGDLTPRPGISIQGEFSRSGELFAWKAAAKLSTEHVAISFELRNQGGGLGYSGGLSLVYEEFSVELLGRLSPLGEWELELLVEFKVSLGDET